MNLPRPLLRFYNRRCLQMMEKRMVTHARDWEGYFSVLTQFEPYQMHKIYLNQVWTEWRSLIEYLLAHKPPKRILEIGTGRGGSTYFLSKLAGEDSLIVTIDIEPTVKGYIDLFKRCKGQRIICIVGSSFAPDTIKAAKQLLGDSPVDFLYIDGDHSYEGVKRDFDIYRQFCSHESLACFHDIHPDYRVSKGIHTDTDSGEVFRFWNEIKHRFRYVEFIESDQQDGFGLGVLHYS